MNQTFSLARFARLNRWFWAAKSRTYLFAALALLPIIILIPAQALKASGTFSLGMQRNDLVYFIFLAVLLTFSVGSDVFSALFRQETAIAYLMIPASRSEKFWLGVLYCLITLLLLSVTYFGLEAIIFAIANSQLPASESYRYVSTLIYHRSGSGDSNLLFLTPYLILISLVIALTGSLFFRRGVFVRNVGVTLITLIGTTLLYRLIVGWHTGGHAVGTALIFHPIAVHTSRSNYEIIAPPVWLMYGAYVGTLLILLMIARIRFNEIEW